MIRKMLAAMSMLGLGLLSASALGAIEYKIVTASASGTYIQIGRNLAELVAPQAEIALEALPSAGSAENVRRLRYEPGVKLALVQSDVYQAFLDEAAGGNLEARDIIRPLRVIVPLYNEEIYFLVRADSPLNFVHEIKAARINVGELGSGTALTTTTLYRLMFNTGVPPENATHYNNEDALAKLLTTKSLDAVAIVAGQPARLLAELKPEARKLIKLLKFDSSRLESQAALKTYVAATVRASSYPNLLAQDVPALAVRAYLVTYDFNLQTTEEYLRRFARSLCKNFSVLQERGHPKWREVQLSLPDLGLGWIYYPATANELRACIGGVVNTKPSAKASAKPCPEAQRVLGLCK